MGIIEPIASLPLFPLLSAMAIIIFGKFLLDLLNSVTKIGSGRARGRGARAGGRALFLLLHRHPETLRPPRHPRSQCRLPLQSQVSDHRYQRLQVQDHRARTSYQNVPGRISRSPIRLSGTHERRTKLDKVENVSLQTIFDSRWSCRSCLGCCKPPIATNRT